MKKPPSLAKIETALAYKVFQIDFSSLIVATMIVLYVIFFSYFTMLRHEMFKTYAWDLGIFNQAFWTTLYHGRIFYSTPEQLINPSGVFFGIHFSPILFVILPIYAIYPTPQTLLIFQSFILALGSIPIYKLSMHVLKNRTASILFVLAYLLYPPMHGINVTDFHVQAFLPFLFLFSMYFLEKQNWKMYLVFIFLALTCEEHVAFIVLFIGLFIIYQHKTHLKIAVKSKNFKDSVFLTVVVTLLLAIFWYIMTLWVRNTFFPLNPSFISTYKASSNWSVLGAADPLLIPIYIFLYPQRAITALQYDFLVKIAYVSALFGPLAFMSFHKLRYLIPTIPWFVYSLFSNYLPYYYIYIQYTAYVIAFIFVSALHSISSSEMIHLNTKRLRAVLLFSLLAFLVVSPASPIVNMFYDFGLRQLTTRETMVREILAHVPPNASIITHNNLFPHVSNRIDAYAFPIYILWSYNPSEWRIFVKETLEKVDYILIDIKADSFAARELFALLREKGDFKVMISADGVVLFKKNYEGNVSVLAPYVVTYNYGSLNLHTGEITSDQEALNTNVLHFNGSHGSSPIFWSSQQTPLPPGNYVVTFRMKIYGIGRLFTIELCTNNGQNILQSKIFNGLEVTLGVWMDYTLYFSCDQPLEDFQIRTAYLQENVDLYLDYVEIKQLA